MAGGPQIMKDKEELQEFFANLGVEYRYSCYSERDPEGCSLLGDYMQIIRKDYARAAKVYQYGCDQFDYWKTCNKFGTYVYLGRGIEKNYKTALNYFNKACKLDSPEGCFHAGQMLTAADPNLAGVITPDIPKAMESFEKGCKLNSWDSCYYAHSIYYSGLHGVQIDRKKAFDLAKRACDESSHYEACNNLKLMYERGHGTVKNLEEAAKLKEKLDDYLEILTKGRSLEMGQGAD